MSWTVIQHPMCDLCARRAVWSHTDGGFRCNRCPRPGYDDVRELAAVICSAAACTPEFNESYAATCEALDIDRYGDAFRLALAAWRKCIAADHPDAEAAALILSGWLPDGFEVQS